MLNLSPLLWAFQSRRFLWRTCIAAGWPHEWWPLFPPDKENEEQVIKATHNEGFKLDTTKARVSANSNYSKEKSKKISKSYHTVHEYEFELVLVEGLVAVLVVGRPDVAGDGGCHSGVSVAVARVSQERAFVIQQATEEFKIKRKGHKSRCGQVNFVKTTIFLRFWTYSTIRSIDNKI